MPRNEGCVLVRAQSRWVLLVHCVQSARKEGGGVLDA